MNTKIKVCDWFDKSISIYFLKSLRHSVPCSIFRNMSGTNPSANTVVRFCDSETNAKVQICNLHFCVIWTSKILCIYTKYMGIWSVLSEFYGKLMVFPPLHRVEKFPYLCRELWINYNSYISLFGLIESVVLIPLRIPMAYLVNNTLAQWECHVYWVEICIKSI